MIKRLAILLVLPPLSALFAGATNDIPFNAAELGVPTVHDGYLYLSADSLSGGGLAVFDLEDPAHPRFAAAVRTAGPAAGAPAFLGDTAYLPTAAGIEVFDVTRPEEPASVTLLAPHAPRPSAATLRAVGERLVAAQADAVRLYDISDPFSPVLTDAAPARALAASRLYLAARDAEGTTNRLFRIDAGRFSDCGPLPDEASTNAAALHFATAKIAYLADGPDALLVADFSDPRRPDIARCTNLPSDFLPPQGQRGRLFAGRTNVLDVVNVWKPLEPHLSRSVVFPDGVDVSRLCVSGEHAYYADNARRALLAYGIAGTNAVPSATNRFARAAVHVDLAPGRLLARALGGDSASLPGATFHADIALADGRLVRSSGLPARPAGVSAADPDAPAREGDAVPLDGAFHGFCAVPGTNLLFAADGCAITVLRLADGGLAREAHFPLSRHPLYGPRALALADNGTNHVLLAACGADGLRAYAFEGTGLVLRATCDTGGFACDVAVSGARVFVADEARGLTVCHYADGKLEKGRTYALPRGAAHAVAARDGIAYVAAGDVPLAVLTEAHPPVLARPDAAMPGAHALDLALFARDDRLYALVAEGRGGLTLFDVTDPQAPAFVTALAADEAGRPILQAVVAVCTDGRRAYALDLRDGLVVVDLDLVFIK